MSGGVYSSKGPTLFTSGIDLFCFLTGGLFTLDDTKVQTFLTGHGSAEFQAHCDSVVPMYKQCSGTRNNHI